MIGKNLLASQIEEEQELAEAYAMPNIRKDEIIINGEWALNIFSDKDDE